ncbi:MAG TPA: 23S rRNA (pseudouridine(1915)-N(3))-methyltransferase RlmH [Terrimicrobiaceae bacterium]
MRWCIVAVGKPRLAHARAGVAEYLARLRCFSTVETAHIKASNPLREGSQLLSRSEGCFRLILDERGKKLTSRAFAEEVKRIECNPRKTCALLVGGADGLSEHVRASADLLWSLGPLTLQHEMALVIALEQIYRAHTILAGIPYHRD